MMQLSTDLPIKELVAIYNQQSATPIKGWKSSKAKLFAKIVALPPKVNGTATGRLPTATGDDADYKAAITVAAISERDSIQVAAEKLLEAVAYQHDDRNWGLPYNMILSEIRKVFPDCKTTVACLRWYAVRMNETGVKLPKRKRSKS